MPSPSASAAVVSRDPFPEDPRLPVRVDRRIELMSILFHLGGSPEYKRVNGRYVAEIDEHFGAAKDDAAVEGARRLRLKHGVGYSAPVTLAMYLDDAFRPLRKLVPAPPGLDHSFDTVPIDEFLEVARTFATKTDFDAFMQAHTAHFAEVENAIRGALTGKDPIGWFDAVFGPKKGATYHVAPGLLTGPMAYGAFAQRLDLTEDVVQVMYLEEPTDEGVPRPTARTMEFLVHELCHSYVNPIFDAEKAKVEAVSRPVFESVEKAMQAQHYTSPDIMVNESVVRAVTLMFLHERSTPAHESASLAEQERLSFKWTADLVAALGDVRAKHAGSLPRAELVAATKKVLTKAAPPKP